MNKGSKKNLWGELLEIADKKSPAILTGCVCAGVIGTALLAWFNGPKAKKVVDDYKEEVKELTEEYLEETTYDHLDEIKEPKTEAAYTHNQVVKEYKEKKAEATGKMILGVAKNVAPVVVMSGTTIACAIGANTVSTKRIAALTAAYSISEKALSEYTAKATELLGDNKMSEVKAAIAEDNIKNNPPTKDNKQVIITGAGDVLCYDTYSGRYFKSNAETIRQKVNELNAQLINEYFISLNEFYNMIGLPNVKLGYDIGFSSDYGLLEVDYSSILTDDNTPVLVINYDVSPKYAEHRGRFND